MAENTETKSAACANACLVRSPMGLAAYAEQGT